jgi:hypothetical protein
MSDPFFGLTLRDPELLDEFNGRAIIPAIPATNKKEQVRSRFSTHILLFTFHAFFLTSHSRQKASGELPDSQPASR